jgi:hypothetical protein
MSFVTMLPGNPEISWAMILARVVFPTPEGPKRAQKLGPDIWQVRFLNT